MDFTLHGSSTPRTHQRILAQAQFEARPLSSRDQQRNHTNKYNGQAVEKQATLNARSHGTTMRPQNVPALDLKALTRDQVKVLNKVPELYDYCLDSPGSASTVSWDTTRATERPYRAASGRLTQKSSHPGIVPGLNLEVDAPQQSHRKPATAVPTAWDKAPVPENIPGPSDKHKAIYSQYREELKEAYKKHTAHTLPQADVDNMIVTVKHTYGKSDLADDPEPGCYAEDAADSKENIQLMYTSQPYTSQQLKKRMDAAELSEYKRKQKLIETVMIDQLSRAVISDPSQDLKSPSQVHTPGMSRGAIRTLHESKVRTSGTATENLLSKRVRFGARILTRDGHDALRELTGFFFHVDNSLTIYEYRQFGKSAKALPFIARGHYSHLTGPRRGESFMITDIYPGSNLYFTPANQHSLPDRMKQQQTVTFRVTDTDDEAKVAILLADVRPSDREHEYARLHMPQSTEELENRVLLLEVQTYVRDLLKMRGVRTVMGLTEHCRHCCKQSGIPDRGRVPRYDLEKALLQYRIDVSPGQLEPLLLLLDDEGTGYLDYSEFLRAVIGEMNEYRKSFVRRAFRKIDAAKLGTVTFSDLKIFYNARKHPKVKSGVCTEASILHSFLESFEHCLKQQVTYEVFEEYYEGISLGICEDEDFASILRNSWNI